ncbi:hypothetical protein [Caldisericum sp.]|uniref:hypothetical protein n=1 Tax=Caldisericum sp. TaxID=2499687 RepID=UPI003D0C6B31
MEKYEMDYIINFYNTEHILFHEGAGNFIEIYPDKKGLQIQEIAEYVINKYKILSTDWDLREIRKTH